MHGKRIATRTALTNKLSLSTSGTLVAGPLPQAARTRRPNVQGRSSGDYNNFGAGAPERLLNQPQALEARVPVLAHDNVVMHGNAQRMGDGDDLLRHLDVGAGRRRIARGVVVQQAV